MYTSTLFKSIATLLLAADYVNAHGAIIKATGDAGGQGMALGVDPNTPRDGTRRAPFQQDSTRFRAQTGVCGETLAGGTNDMDAGTTTIMGMTGGAPLPQVNPGGSVDMTLHQVNADGGGPYTCELDQTGTGQNFQDIQVMTNIPGRNSNNRAGAETDFPLKAALPATMKCTGTVAGQENVCMVRCMNAARAGPFGGCVPVQQVGAAAAGAAGEGAAKPAARSLGQAAQAKAFAVKAGRSVEDAAKALKARVVASFEEDEEDEDDEE